MITIQDAERNAQIVNESAANASHTICRARAVIPTNKKNGFHLALIVGLCPYSTDAKNPPAIWQQIEGGQRETLYAHIVHILIPESAMDDETKLKQIGAALSDIWYESRYFPALRKDRRYIIPHINETPVGY